DEIAHNGHAESGATGGAPCRKKGIKNARQIFGCDTPPEILHGHKIGARIAPEHNPQLTAVAFRIRVAVGICQQVQHNLREMSSIAFPLAITLGQLINDADLEM